MTDEENQEKFFSTFELFQQSEKRVRALLRLQEGIDILMESEGDFIGYFIEKMRNSPYAPHVRRLIEIPKRYMADSTMATPEDITLKENESIELSLEIEEIFSEIGKEGLEEMLKPIIETIEAVDLIYESPLYHEAVVSSVTSFETYLKDILVDLIAHNDTIEKRFHKELEPGMPYRIWKECDFDKHDVIRCMVSDKCNFFNLDEVEEIFERTFGDKKAFSIFSNNTEKNDLIKYIELRHIIVHNGGYVDNKFKRITQCPEQINDFFEIEKDYIKRMMEIILSIVKKIEREIEQGKYKLKCGSENNIIDP